LVGDGPTAQVHTAGALLPFGTGGEARATHAKYKPCSSLGYTRDAREMHARYSRCSLSLLDTGRDMGETQARHKRDTREMQARYRRDAGEMQARSWRDAGEMQANNKRKTLSWEAPRGAHIVPRLLLACVVGLPSHAPRRTPATTSQGTGRTANGLQSPGRGRWRTAPSYWQCTRRRRAGIRAFRILKSARCQTEPSSRS